MCHGVDVRFDLFLNHMIVIVIIVGVEGSV